MTKRRLGWSFVLAVALVASATACSPAATSGSGWVPGDAPLSTEWTELVGPENALVEYPRPQLARPTLISPNWENLNGEWQFQAWDGESEIPFGQDLDQRVLVPFPTESALSGIQDHSECSLYRTEFEVPADWVVNGERVRLNFGAVNHEATVFVNGQTVAVHSGSFDAFATDVTDALLDHGPQELVVAVRSPIDRENIPVGKQRLEPGGIFYTASSGIWQTVWIEPVPAVSIASIWADADLADSQFAVQASYDGDASGDRLTVRAYADEKLVGEVTGPAESELELPIGSPRPWSPDDPFLYTLVATLESGDRVESYAGLREVAVEDVGGKKRITLNGDAVFLLATLDQGYWPDGIYTAPTDEALRFDIEQTKGLGFNTIRKHVKVEPARWYYWTDVLGVMVWQDIPSMPNGRNDSIAAHEQRNFAEETSRIIEQFRWSPSIVGWVVNNEGWGQWSSDGIRELAAMAADADPTRLINARSGTNCCDSPGDPHAGDVIDWHAYQGPALPSPDAVRAAIDGEHGGISFPVEGHMWPGADLNPYGGVSDTEALTAAYVENTRALLEWAPLFNMSGSVYTQLTDVETENNGLLTYDRRVLKVDPERVREINDKQ